MSPPVLVTRTSPKGDSSLPHSFNDITSERILQMIVYAYAYRKSPRGCDVRQFTDPLTPDEYPGEPASVKAQHWADENIQHYEMIQVRDALGNLLYAR